MFWVVSPCSWFCALINYHRTYPYIRLKIAVLFLKRESTVFEFRHFHLARARESGGGFFGTEPLDLDFEHVDLGLSFGAELVQVVVVLLNKAGLYPEDVEFGGAHG